MKPADVKSSVYVYFCKENNKESPKFKVAENVRIAKYKSAFAKEFVPIWSEEDFVIKKSWKYCTMDICY